VTVTQGIFNLVGLQKGYHNASGALWDENLAKFISPQNPGKSISSAGFMYPILG